MTAGVRKIPEPMVMPITSPSTLQVPRRRESVSVEPDSIATAIRAFAGVPHRLETIAEHGGVRWVTEMGIGLGGGAGRLKVLFIGYIWPEPQSSAAGLGWASEAGGS